MKPEKNILRDKKGFTLIEIIIVLVVLGIIADKTRDRTASLDYSSIKET